MFNLKDSSLRIRIFIAMIFLVLVASVLIAAVTIYQYEEQTKEYNIQRFGRKETNTKKSIELALKTNTAVLATSGNLATIFRERIYEIAAIHTLNITMYSLEGTLLKTSVATGFQQVSQPSLLPETLQELATNTTHKIFKTRTNKGVEHQTSYTYITDTKSKRIGILELQFFQDNSEQEKELKEFMYRLGFVYVFMFLTAIVLAYILSSYITRSIKTISDKLQHTQLHKRNEKISLLSASSEIKTLVAAYNSMIDELQESAVKLAKSEREQAWREMAKQVAHEIKNPLTPMRLSVQSFERKFDPVDPKAKEKLAEYSQTLIQQIDVMNSIATAFSDFAKMPTQKREELELVSVVKLALDIFDETYITYLPKVSEIYVHLDKTQLIRVVTNLVKNATQAVEDQEEKQIAVSVFLKESAICIEVSDNGKGIKDELKSLVFEPKFTTKSSGMGLGLPMIKNIIEAYDGTISFVSIAGEGTVFTVILPKI